MPEASVEETKLLTFWACGECGIIALGSVENAHQAEHEPRCTHTRHMMWEFRSEEPGCLRPYDATGMTITDRDDGTFLVFQMSPVEAYETIARYRSIDPQLRLAEVVPKPA